MELVEEHLKELKKYLEIWKRYKKEVKFWDFYENIDVQNMVLHCLFVAIQSAIDVANDIIVMKNLEEPSTYKESFEILRKNKIIPERLAKNLMALAGFRNIIAHLYFRVDTEKAYRVLKAGDRHLEEFFKIVRKFAKK